MIDWRLARATGARLSRPGPDVSPAEAAEVVEELRVAAARAQLPVREFTGLSAPTDATPVLVVDRPRWIEANLGSFSELLGPTLEKLDARTNAMTRRVGGAVSGAELGAVLALVSSRVLGQFDPFWTGPGGEPGRLLLVAPNIVQIERKLGVVPSDFRLWVCLHEETHRVQFTANPWLRDHLRSIVQEFLDQTDADAVSRIAEQLGKALRGEVELSFQELFQSDEQRALVARATGVMSLLEGHADVVMDGVGPEVVPTVATIRRRFSQRRESAGPLDRILRKVLGMEGKLRQYQEGAAFVRAVVDAVGMEGFNDVWTSAETLPSHAEVLDPTLWLARVSP
ncbi:zinc-dependent metalloprotease [Aeromicrobium sp. Leaf350]|uniref:zinc-dependent metalloprotease n=1 Tax=Aeromicrobium sp. Leaf350 TaxID=2876565 RepID=UPI001E5FB61E|nr:zinc-dependent metalloprotease [Aeromicrobium sp. Leaf350]